MRSPDGSSVAVFKPEDEEPLAVNNPRGIGSGLPPLHTNNGMKPAPVEGLRKGTIVGEGPVREVAAFLLDHDGFSGVPPTTLACLVGGEIRSPKGSEKVKRGSLQAFVRSDGEAEEMGTSAFPVNEVHKITILDVRLGNTDRNGGATLFKIFNLF